MRYWSKENNSNPSISAIGLQWFATAGFFFCLRRLFCGRTDEHSAHCVCGFFLCCKVQMRINVCGSCEGAVSQPDLNLLHRDSVAEKQAGAGMSEVVEANLLQVILLDEPCEVFRHIVGPQELAGLVDTDVVEVIPAVGLLEESAEHFLFLLFLQQEFLHCGDERQGSEAGFGLEDIFAYRSELPVDFGLDDLVLDGDGLALRVDGIPSQAEDFAPAQTVVGCDFHTQLQRVTGYGIKQRHHFILAVEVAVEDILLGALYLIHRVLRDDVLFHCHLHRLAENGVIVNHRVGGAVIVQYRLVEPLYRLF